MHHSPSAPTSTSTASPSTRPRNGIAGLKEWRYDIVAGLMVSLTSLPLSLGIAVASGAPPLAGLTSAIIAGLVFPFLGGAYMTISGPAAGLAPALYAAMLALGQGSLDKGYPLLLGVICIVGLVQVILSLLGAAKLSAAMPVAVVEGMLASIGLMIIAKELPHFIGHSFKSHAFFGILAEVPEEIQVMDTPSFLVGLVSLALMFGLSMNRVRSRLPFPVPPPLATVIVGLILGQILKIDDHHRINIPGNLLEHGLVMPDFPGLFANGAIRWALITSVITLVLIDGIESLATIKAIDKIDVFRRRSNPDRTLLAMGVSNIASSLGGGLTIIPGGVKSKLNIVSGGRTLWANFYNAVFLLVFLIFGRSIINLIPYSALAAILIYTGIRMCEPKVWKHVAHIGTEQLLLFSTTVLATLMEDLLVGILAGMAMKLLLVLFYTRKHAMGGPIARATQFFRNPVVGRDQADGVYQLQLDRPMVCFNSFFLNRELERVPADADEVRLEIGPKVAMIDHTSVDLLLHFSDEYHEQTGKAVKIQGLDDMRRPSKDHAGMRLAPPRILEPAGVTGGDDLADVMPLD